MVGTGLEDLEGVCADETVPSYCTGRGGGFIEEGEFGAGGDLEVGLGWV